MRKLILLPALLLALVMCRTAGAADTDSAEFAAPDEVKTHVVKVLRTTNKAQTNRYVPKVYDFQHANPYDVLRFIVRVAQIEEGAWFVYGKPENPDDPDSVKGGKVAMVAPLYQLPYIDELMKVIDRTGLTTSSGDKAYYYRPKHRHVDDSSFVDVITAVLAPNRSSGDQVADSEVNGFLFYDSPSGIEDVKRWLPIVDQPPPQVMIEATVYEINVENDDALGLDYVSWKNGPGRDLFTFGAFHEKERIARLNGVYAEPMFTNGLGDFETRGHYSSYYLDLPSEFFDFLVTKQKARVMTSAKAVTRNGEPALLVASDHIFYWKVTDPAYDREVNGAKVTREFSDAEAGVFLALSPVIGEEGVNLGIDLDVVSHTGFTSDGQPQLVSRSFDTVLRIQDGQEIILGGYDRQMTIQQSNKIPFLGSLPVIGWLFGGEENLVKKRKVVVALSATIVKDFSAMSGANSEIDAALIRSRAKGEWPVETLETEVGFDQWLLDDEKGQ